jgi:uncharacterized membrane protein YccC
VRLPRISDPGLYALKSAARVAVVMPAAFAVAHEVVGDEQTALFAGFGSMALLVFADFSGPARERLVAYLSLAVLGCALIALGTLVSRTTWLAAVLMALVGFAILFSGIIDGYFAAAGSAAILLFVLPVMVAGAPGVIPERLAGWGLACGASIAAAMLVWPRLARDQIRLSVADASRALADCIDAGGREDPALAAEHEASFMSALRRVRRVFSASPYRPTGPTGRSAALARLIDDLGWTHAFAVAVPAGSTATPECAEAHRAAMATLRGAAQRLRGRAAALELDRLERAWRGVEPAFVERSVVGGRELDEPAVASALDAAFASRGLASATWMLGRHALLAAGDPAPDPDAGHAVAPMVRQEAARQLAATYVSMRSVWFRNSVRGAVGLAVAVLVAQLIDVQHGFWVVLGTLSVLRSRALGTGGSIVQAILGTTAGIVVGGALVAAIGADRVLLWVLLPIAVFLASYAIHAVSFAAGQAGFTVLVLVLFDILAPGGWNVGLVRIEDVVIGCAISLAVGILMWPRGARGVLREALAAAYREGADYVAAVVAARSDGGGDDEVQRAAAAAVVAGQRLDDAFRQSMGERRTGDEHFASFAALIGGASRLRQVARALRVERPTPTGDGAAPEPAREALAGEAQALRAWFGALGAALAARTAPPEPQARDGQARARVLLLSREAPTPSAQGGALSVAWALEDLGILRRIEPHLAAAAASLHAGPAGYKSVPSSRRKRSFWAGVP